MTGSTVPTIESPGSTAPALEPTPRRTPADRLGIWVAALLALGAAAWALKLWRADIAVPFRYSSDDDTMFYLSLIKGIIDHGWFLTNHNLGAPFGQQLYDYPQSADNLNLLFIKGLGTVWHSPAVINLFFLSTFPLDAAAAYAVMRRLGVSVVSAVLCAVLFALLPYHFFRSDSHLFLSAYYSLALAAYLFLCVLDDRQLFAHRAPPSRRILTWATARTGWTVLLCVVIASTGLYYAVFGLVLLLAGTLLALLARRGRAAVLTGAVTCCVVAGALVINLAPTFVYQLSHGGNPVVTRSAGAGDGLALSPSYLVLPPLHDRIGPLRRTTEHYAAQTAPHGYCEQCYESLGSVGDVGFLWLIAIALAACLGAPLAFVRGRLHRAAAAGIVVCLAVGITGGLSSLTRVFVTSDIRAWNRLSVLITFFSLLAVGLLLDGLRRRLRSRARGGLAFGALVAGLLLFGIADQTSSFFVPPYKQDARQYHSDGRFVGSIERRLPADASLFELPYVPFPEGYQPFMSPGQTVPNAPRVSFEYDQARGYIHSHGLRWSYGATKGRPTDWEAQLASKPVGLALAGAAAAGFQGVTIDRRGYPGTLGISLRNQLRAELAVPPLLSPDRDLMFYDLRPLLARLRTGYTGAQLDALRTAVLSPLALSCARGSLTVVNPGAGARTGTLSATLVGGSSLGLRVSSAAAPTGSSGALRTGRSRTIRVRLSLPPGRTTITLSAGTPGSRTAALLGPTITDSTFTPFARFASSHIRTGILGPPCALVAS
jgi:phosphoglycerol transferase